MTEEDKVQEAAPTSFKDVTLDNAKKFSQNAVYLWAGAALVAGGILGYLSYGAMNNQVVAHGDGMSLTKAEITSKLTDTSSSVLFATVKSSAMQQLYPQDELKSDSAAEKAGEKLIDQYIKNNGGEATLNKTLKAQGTTVAKWRKTMASQATAQAKSQAQAKQNLALVKEAGVVSDKDVTAATKDYRMYVVNAYLVKDEDTANKVNGELKASQDVASSDYTQHQDDLKVSSVDNNSDSSDVLAALKSANKGDVVNIKLSSGSGYYVFQVKNAYSYEDYKKNNDSDGISQIKKAVTESLNENAALSATTLGKAQAKIFKKHDIHFKDSSLDKQFYSSLTSTSATSSLTSSSSDSSDSSSN